MKKNRKMERVFNLQKQLKALTKKTEYTPQRVHVIGAGTMGGDIAAWCALKGLEVTLQSQSPERVTQAIQRAHHFYQQKLKRPDLMQAAVNRLKPDPAGTHISNADIVIEAIVEDLDAKQALFQKIESTVNPAAILATNTSSISLEEISVVLKKPTQLVGLHFFNPVAQMPLVEVVSTQKTSDENISNAMAFLGTINRLPLPVKNNPGFLVNRVLMHYLTESFFLFEEGIPVDVIDRSAVEFGMPMGPLALADKIGLDICISVLDNLVNFYGGNTLEKLHAMVKAGYLGIKSDKGFYRYRHGELLEETSASVASTPTSPDIRDRLILRMLNEVVACWHERIVANADFLDAGMIFGIGFPPAHGGPIQYIKKHGITTLINQLESLASRYGDRFKPSIGWQELKAISHSF